MGAAYKAKDSENIMKTLILILILALTLSTLAENRINISGRITSANTPFVARIVTVTATDLNGSNGTVTSRVNAFGYYTFYNLEGGNSYLIEPHSPKATLAFEPETRTVNQGVLTADFTYSPYGVCRSWFCPF